MAWWWPLAGAIPFYLALCATVGPVRQSDRYHRFADTRSCCGVPNIMDVWSNAGFAAVGLAGAAAVPPRHPLREPWLAFFAGVAATAAGSAYYHWSPTSRRLVWDRLPMAVGFASLFVAAAADRAAAAPPPAGEVRLALAGWLLLGMGSVCRWARSGDLRAYIAVQYYPILCLLVWRQPVYSSMLGWYALAKLAEILDRPVFRWTGGRLSGHTLKHLLATAAAARAVAPVAAAARAPAAAATPV